jgi:hypothetical protein
MSNAGKIWTHKEEIDLINEVNNKKSLKIICETHQRKLGGIKSRIKKIINKTNLNIEELNKLYELDINNEICLISSTEAKNLSDNYNSIDKYITEINYQIITACKLKLYKLEFNIQTCDLNLENNLIKILKEKKYNVESMLDYITNNKYLEISWN